MEDEDDGASGVHSLGPVPMFTVSRDSVAEVCVSCDLIIGSIFEKNKTKTPMNFS